MSVIAVSIDFSSLVMGYIFLFLCLSDNFLLDTEHCDSYIVECWILLYFFKVLKFVLAHRKLLEDQFKHFEACF